MSRQPQKRNKFAVKPTSLYTTTLETIKEDEDLATTLSAWQVPNASASKSVRKAFKHGRRRKVKRSAAPSELRSKPPISDELRALWRAIDPRTREELTLNLEWLVDAINTEGDGSSNGRVAWIQLLLDLRHPSSRDVVTHFIPLLRNKEGPAQTLQQITLLRDALPVDTDATIAMAVDSGSDGVSTMASDRSAGGDVIIGMSLEMGIDGDATMESNSSAGGKTSSSITSDNVSGEDARMADSIRSSESTTSPMEVSEDQNSSNSAMSGVVAWASDEGRGID